MSRKSISLKISIVVAATFFFARATKAQLSFDLFVDPHTVVSGGPIGFTFAGDKFVGSVQNDGVGVLYETDLNGSGLKVFAPTVKVPFGSAASEHYVASSFGLGGFPKWDIYVAAAGNILHISHDGQNSDMFATGFAGPIRSLRFDLVGTFGHDMLVATLLGNIYRVNSSGHFSLLASLGEDIEGMDVAPLGAEFGSFDGQLITVAESSGLVRAVAADGQVVTVLNPNHRLQDAESVNFVPLTIGSTGSPVEGYYQPNFPLNVQKVSANQFASFKGDAIIGGEVVRTIWRMHWNGQAFDITVIGNSLNQAEDAIMVTPAMLGGGGCPANPSERDTVDDDWCKPFCKQVKRQSSVAHNPQ